MAARPVKPRVGESDTVVKGGNMPVSVRIDPFSQRPIRPDQPLRTPQARVLAALQPEYPDDPVSEWPLITRAQLAVRAGYTAISGTLTRALNGQRPGGVNEPHPGLLALGFIEEVVLDIEGRREVNYRSTAAGVRKYADHVAGSNGRLPEVRDRTICINDRYKDKDTV